MEGFTIVVFKGERQASTSEGLYHLSEVLILLDAFELVGFRDELYFGLIALGRYAVDYF